MVFHCSLSDSKSPQVSRTRLRILSNAVISIVSTRPPTSKSPRPFNNPLVIVPKAPITIGTIVTFMFHSFFSSLARSRYSFSHSFRFILWSAGTGKSTILQILFFYWFFNWVPFYSQRNSFQRIFVSNRYIYIVFQKLQLSRLGSGEYTDCIYAEG